MPQMAKADVGQWFIFYQNNPVAGPYPSILACQAGMAQFGLYYPSNCEMATSPQGYSTFFLNQPLLTSIYATFPPMAQPLSQPQYVQQAPQYVQPQPVYVVPIIPQYVPVPAPYIYAPVSPFGIRLNINIGGGYHGYRR